MLAAPFPFDILFVHMLAVVDLDEIFMESFVLFEVHFALRALFHSGSAVEIECLPSGPKAVLLFDPSVHR